VSDPVVLMIDASEAERFIEAYVEAHGRPPHGCRRAWLLAETRRKLAEAPRTVTGG